MPFLNYKHLKLLIPRGHLCWQALYIQITIPCFCIKMIRCFNDIHRLVNKMIVLLSEDLLCEFLLCHADVPSLQHLSFWFSKNICKVNYVYVYTLLYCTHAIYIYMVHVRSYLNFSAEIRGLPSRKTMNGSQNFPQSIHTRSAK